MYLPGHETVILCIDDEPVALETRRLVLVHAGYTVLTACDGPSGLGVFRDQHIDLVITDHLLPGQTGCQLAKEMKRVKPEVPVAMLSGLVDRPEDATATDAFLVKGIPIPEFLAAVAALLPAA
jgi:DNA-binding response OmpR family regulator